MAFDLTTQPSNHFQTLLCIGLLWNLVSPSSGALSFAQWGKPCKIPDPKKDELIDQRFECDVAKGLICEAYTQGVFCGCRVGGSLTYDRSSGECRRKVAAECHMVSTEEEYAKLPFNRKCHENAQCTRYNGTLIGTTESSVRRLNTPICICKDGYQASRDFSSCHHPNGSSLGPNYSIYSSVLCSFLLGFSSWLLT